MLRVFERPPSAITPEEQRVLDLIPDPPAFAEYWRTVRNTAGLDQASAQQALLSLVLARRAHVIPHPEQPGCSAVARGSHPRPGGA